ncbi:COP1 ligase, partial [Polypterus senegalus]
MSSSRQQQQNGGGVGSGPGTSSGTSSGSSSNNTSIGVSNTTNNSSNSGNGISSRTLGIGAVGLGVSSSRGSASLGRSVSSSSRKRPLPTPLCNGLLNSYEDKSNDFVCPICFEMIEEAHMTKCGHSFCYKCIRQSLEDTNRCPKCNYVIDNMDQLYPNFLVIQYIRHNVPPDIKSEPDMAVQYVTKRMEKAGAISGHGNHLQLEQLQKELNYLEEDIKRVEGKRQTWYNSTLASRRKRLTAHFEDLEQCYFSNRMSRITDENRTTNQLDDFMECLSKFTRYNSVRPLATLSYASDLYNGSSIVSSIEFDRDCDYFAIAGVTKKIKVFEYGTVIQDAVDIHYPVNEMTCNSKISCISWSSYHKNLLASSDYEGTVILWDGFTGQRSKVYQEHEKRCWSVDFNLMDPKLLASGSDDAKDHCVHYYDLRNTKQPIMVFKGHRKAVSYAKFVNGEEIVSASTDSQLKLWNVNKPHCLRSFKGHINEKNFVGLASNGDYVACGSENNSLYLYYKGLSKTLLTFKFDTVKSVLDKDKKEDDTNEFVSAVCWRALPDEESNVLIAANSQGTIKEFKMMKSCDLVVKFLNDFRAWKAAYKLTLNANRKV